MCKIAAQQPEGEQQYTGVGGRDGEPDAVDAQQGRQGDEEETDAYEPAGAGAECGQVALRKCREEALREDIETAGQEAQGKELEPGGCQQLDLAALGDKDFDQRFGKELGRTEGEQGSNRDGGQEKPAVSAMRISSERPDAPVLVMTLAR